MPALYRPLLALTLSVAAFSCAAAVPVYTKIEGKTLDFYYAANAFQGAIAYTLGDTLAFQPRRGFSEMQSEGFEVIAVAHNGYALTGGINQAMQGYHSTISGNTRLRLDGIYETRSGSFSDGNFHAGLAGAIDMIYTRIDGQPGQSNTFWNTQFGTHPYLGQFSAMGVSSRYWGSVYDYIYGVYGEVGITSLMYTFDAVALPPPAVPEPQTYAMLLGGLGLVGAAARRRRTRRS